MNVWIVGCGDIGRRVAKLYQKQDIDARGLVHSSASVEACQSVGVSAQTYDLDQPKQALNKTLFHNADVFYFAPPQTEGTEDQRLKSFLEILGAAPRKIVLISTTGVYGDSKGDWIDESFAVAPKADRAKRRLSTERHLQTWSERYQKPIVVLRVPGIYALDRLPTSRLKKGLPLVKVDEAPWTNRIHADDLATVCIKAMQHNTNSTIYNVTDGSPSTMTDYFDQVADATGLPRAPKISMAEAIQTLSKGMVSYLQESRRIRNEKMLEELDIKLRYPDLATGLRSTP